MYKSKRRPDENEAGNASLIPTYADFKSRHGALETIWGIEISDLISLKWTFITPRGEKKNHAPKPTAKLWICELSHWWDSLVCALWQVFVGWVKPYTAYPARAAFWKAAVFPGLTMKYHVFIGRDTIEKDVGNASLIPTYADFKSHHGVRSQTMRSKLIS